MENESAPEVEPGTNIEVFDNPFIKFVYFGKIPPEKIVTRMTGKKPTPEPRLLAMYKQRVEKKRQEVLEKAAKTGQEILFYDGPLPRVDHLKAVKDESVVIDIGETSYFQNIAWREPSIFKELGLGNIEAPKHHQLKGKIWEEFTLEYASNPLTVEAAIVVENGKYILVTRSKKATAEKSLIEGLAGYVSMRDIDDAGNVKPEIGALREVEEESGIKRDEIKNFSLRGRIADRGLNKVDTVLIWTGFAPQLTREEIKTRPKDEEVELLFVPYERRALQRAILEFATIEQGYLAGALMALAIDKWGQKVAEFINQRLTRRGKVYFERLGEEKLAKVRTKQAVKANRAVFETSEGKPREQKEKEIDFSNIQYLISDWDGTFVDSINSYAASFGKTLSSRFGFDSEATGSFFKELSGVPLTVLMKEAIKKFAGTEIEDTRSLEEDFWQNLVGLKPEIIPGAKEFLASLKERGVKVIVWSGSRTDVLGEKIELLSLLPYIDFYIGNVPGNETLVKGPGLFKIIAQHFGTTPEEMKVKTLVVGDGEGDMEAGKATGAKTAGYVKLKTADQLKEAGADFVFDDFEKLLGKLKIN